MDTTLQTIYNTLAKSDLNQSARDEFIAMLLWAEDAALAQIAALLAEDINWAEKLYANHKSKQAAIAADDPAAWEKIIQEEEKMLREMAE